MSVGNMDMTVTEGREESGGQGLRGKVSGLRLCSGCVRAGRFYVNTPGSDPLVHRRRSEM